jgi:hypothetical protein
MVTVVCTCISLSFACPEFPMQGGKSSKFASNNLHRRLTDEEAYHRKKYKAALKDAFLGTDKELRDGTFGLPS